MGLIDHNGACLGSSDLGEWEVYDKLIIVVRRIDLNNEIGWRVDLSNHSNS